MKSVSVITSDRRPSRAAVSPVYDLYWRFATERQAIFFARLEGQPSPWTSDPVLQAYRFTNAYRASDMGPDAARLIPLLGLAGEAGQLLSEFKKRLRDGPSHVQFVDHVAEELGDILWYLANTASKYGLDLDDVAASNLKKVKALYDRTIPPLDYDGAFGEGERLPRRFIVDFRELRDGARVEVRTEIDGRLIGSALTDNAYYDDGYRFHDVFHIAYAAILGWSPVLRGLLRLKRRSQPLIDEVEDGGRAAVIEEGVAAVAFDYARRHNFLANVSDLDEHLLTTLRGMCEHLEVSQQPPSLWRQAVLDGFAVWREGECGVLREYPQSLRRLHCRVGHGPPHLPASCGLRGLTGSQKDLSRQGQPHDERCETSCSHTRAVQPQHQRRISVPSAPLRRLSDRQCAPTVSLTPNPVTAFRR